MICQIFVSLVIKAAIGLIETLSHISDVNFFDSVGVGGGGVDAGARFSLSHTSTSDKHGNNCGGVVLFDVGVGSSLSHTSTSDEHGNNSSGVILINAGFFGIKRITQFLQRVEKLFDSLL